MQRIFYSNESGSGSAGSGNTSDNSGKQKFPEDRGNTRPQNTRWWWPSQMASWIKKDMEPAKVFWDTLKEEKAPDQKPLIVGRGRNG